MKIKNYHLAFRSLQNRQKTDLFVIHHTGNPTNDDISALDIHNSHLTLGWSGIGYHYVIRKDGTIEKGRPHWTTGAHAEGENSHTIGIHVCGNFQIGMPTSEQIESLACLLARLGHDYGLELTRDNVKGHRELMPTACPGDNLYNLLQIVCGKGIWYQHNNNPLESI